MTNSYTFQENFVGDVRITIESNSIVLENILTTFSYGNLYSQFHKYGIDVTDINNKLTLINNSNNNYKIILELELNSLLIELSSDTSPIYISPSGIFGSSSDDSCEYPISDLLTQKYSELESANATPIIYFKNIDGIPKQIKIVARYSRGTFNLIPEEFSLNNSVTGTQSYVDFCLKGNTCIIN